jgi:dipeptidyl aminopeptidase/acylaminoacyl peptidase
MEGGLLRIWFAKLLEALRFDRSASARNRADVAANRLVERFEVVSDGLKIRGQIFYPVSRPARMYPTLLICHGIPGGPYPPPTDDPGYEGLAEEFSALGIACVIFNFRGCGDSEGNFDIIGWTRDLEVVVDQVLNTPYVDPTRLVVLGFSAGGAAAIMVAAESSDVYALAVAGTPAHFGILARDAREVVEDFRSRGIIRDPDFPRDLDRWMEGFSKIEPRRWIPHFKGNHLLIIHGDEDELIPVEQAQELFDAAPAGLAKLSVIPGGQHQLRKDPRCIEETKNWILALLGWRDRQE